MLTTGGLYAPTIRHHSGITYILCTNIVHDHKGPSDSDVVDLSENFFVTTKDIWSNEWSDPIPFEFSGIDPSFFFDDDGRAYIQGSAAPGPFTKIKQFEVDLKTGKKLTEEKKLWDGTGGIYPEGPHLYKKDGWYYLMISEGGTHENHVITVARSKDVWGPYEAFEKNPILTARGTDEYIRYTGHCDVVQDQNGQWWGVCLGVRKDEGRYVMGRETFLTTGAWPKGDWPTLTQVKLNPVLPNGQELLRSLDTPALMVENLSDFLYLRDADLSKHQIAADRKAVTLTAGQGDISQWQKPVTFVGKRQRLLDGSSTVKMHGAAEASGDNVKAGLAYYKDEHRYARVFYDFATASLVFEVVNNAKSISKTAKIEGVQLKDDGSLDFRLEYTEREYKFSVRDDSSVDWKVAGSLDTVDMTGPDFVGPLVGVFAVGRTGTVQVKFTDLQID